MNTLYKARTIEDVKKLIHPNILYQIPQDKINDISENILLFERYFRGEVFLTPLDLTVTRFYDHIANQITQIDFEGTSYKL